MGGNTILQQRLGKGGNIYRIPDFYSVGEFSFRPVDEKEMKDKIKGVVVDIIKERFIMLQLLR
ncbi:hypothetical protein [Candidatus Nanopusillus massiliensis]|uniref:hypothetical protein n=1 Tax=Candidatus Nanopusillus massiliensis TaxID=2897163 RepID=UPI001E4491C7|nr:hypothetical protein [Candidatus Nanopusillus massiliensis]